MKECRYSPTIVTSPISWSAEPSNMPSQPPIPPLLSPNLSPPPYTSLTLLTSTLGATINWLVLRFIYSALKSKGHGIGHDIYRIQRGFHNPRIVLVSWLRDGSWWRESGRKLVSISWVSASMWLTIIRRGLELIGTRF